MSWDWQTREGFSFWRVLRGKVISSSAVGECLFEDERPTRLWVDRGLNVRHGDLALWHFPRTGEYLAKYLLEVDGVEWLSCKTGARRRQGDEHVVGRVVLTMRGTGQNLANPAASAKLAEDVRALRASPPRHASFCVFQRDLLDLEEQRHAIAEHVRGCRRAALLNVHRAFGI
jgi:hypothetical protein